MKSLSLTCLNDVITSVNQTCLTSLVKDPCYNFSGKRSVPLQSYVQWYLCEPIMSSYTNLNRRSPSQIQFFLHPYEMILCLRFWTAVLYSEADWTAHIGIIL